jgi:hypothetical protein
VLVEEKWSLDQIVELIDSGRKSAKDNGPGALMRCRGDMDMRCESGKMRNGR